MTETIPDYLSLSSSSFKTTFFPELKRLYKPLDFEDLQCLSILTHKLFLVNFHRKLWQTYSDCGAGQIHQRKKFHLYMHRKPIPVWCRQVIALIITQQYNNITNVNDITESIYMDFIKKKQLDLDNQAKQCQIQLDLYKQRIEHEVEALMYKIDQFIQKSDTMMATKLHFEAQIELVEYSYIDELLQNEYHQYELNDEQVCY